MQPFPHPTDATHKIWSRLANWLQRYSSLKVWTTTDDDGPLVYYKLTLWAFGSGELKIWTCAVSTEKHLSKISIPRQFFNKWDMTWQNHQNGCAPSKDSDQHGHPPSLNRVFAARMKNLGFLASHWAHSKDWSDWVNAQADLSLHWAHTPFVGIVMSWLKWLSTLEFRISEEVLF